MFSLLALSFCLYISNVICVTNNDDSAIDAGLKNWRKMIPGPEAKIPGSVLGFVDEVTFSDIGTMKRTGETTSTYTDNENLTFHGNFGFSDLKLSDLTMKADDAFVTLGEVDLNKATITSLDNSIEVEYSARLSQEHCMVSWNKFKITKFEKVKLNGDQDVTEEFGEKVLPSLNRHLGDKPFLKLLAEYMTPCKMESPLRKLFWM